MKKNYLLVMPKITESKNEWYTFPLGIAYVSSSFKAAGFNVTSINLNNQDLTVWEVLQNKIEELDIDVLCVGGLTGQYKAIRNVVDAARSIKKNIITVVGGGFITSDPTPAMMCIENADIGIIGEGEITICEMAWAIENSSSLKDVKGLIIKQEDGYFITERRQEIADLDSLPWPDYEGFDFAHTLNTYDNENGNIGNGVMSMLCGRSCPFNCTFCFHPSGETYRLRGLDSFFEELDYLVKKYPIKKVMILDELFAADRKRLEEFCRRIKVYDIKWIASLRVSIVTKEILQIMKDSNCDYIPFGVESADDSILASMKKFITVQQIDNAFQLADEIGMRTNGGLIFGDKCETMETVRNTLEWRKRNMQRELIMNMIIVFPGSELYKYACDTGIIKDKVKYIQEGCPFINVSQLSDEDYFALAEEIQKDRVDRLGIERSLTEKECYQIYKNLKDLSEKYSICIWGLGLHITTVFNSFPELEKQDFLIIDRSKEKQKELFHGLKVMPPDFLKNKKYDIVIIASSRNKYIDIEMHLKLVLDNSDRVNILKIHQLSDENWKFREEDGNAVGVFAQHLKL